ncbi:MAG: CHAT domain-containing protein, partial [Acidobacteria bacterium]|nr:CHAT domain-containing protein [Acidobacteriota bacterium]
VPGKRTSAPQSQPLVTQNEVVIAPSASVVAMLRREAAGRARPSKAVAVLADPVFDSHDARISVRSQISEVRFAGAATHGNGQLPRDVQRSWGDVDASGVPWRLPRLLFSRREADTIIRQMKSEDSFEAVDFQASRATAIGPDLAQYRVVHFATHAMSDSRTPALSGIVLSLVDSRGKPEDGFLRLWDIYNLHLPVDLVVLSGCQTALGRDIKGEGLVGLTRGFMYAGATRIMASLWAVDDAATAEFMAHFYQAMLKENLRPAAALRRAQLYMRDQERWRGDPYYWAAFQLQGEWK